ncbi:hypothetical protein, partial [Rhodomicrobium udaipurense]|uniref:hypothetical protein n=1 Tax=Rhodomicrobium udaipurense TaxID=1202716 RepID=UPI001AEE8195
AKRFAKDVMLKNTASSRRLPDGNALDMMISETCLENASYVETPYATFSLCSMRIGHLWKSGKYAVTI